MFRWSTKSRVRQIPWIAVHERSKVVMSSPFPLSINLQYFHCPAKAIPGPNVWESALPSSLSSTAHQTAITPHLPACLFKYVLTTYDALSPEVIQKIAALNVFFIVLWHCQLTAAFIKQEMKRGTANIGIWMALRIPIKSRWYCGHIGLSCAEECTLQLSVWWMRVNAVSSWTAQHAGVIGSAQSSLHSVSWPGLLCHNIIGWKRILIVGSVGVILALSPFHVVFCSVRHVEISILNLRR